jgi:predicted transcriptional regulator
MSIKPEFAERILSGEKRVEFRKRAFRENVSHVVIYSTTPVAAIVGIFEVDGVFVATPAAVWRRYASVAGIGRNSYGAYYHNQQQAVAIRVGNAVQFMSALPLSSVGQRRPPQSFRYLRNVSLPKLIAAGRARIS